MVSAFGPKSACRVPVAIDLFPIRYFFVIFRRKGYITSIFTSSPEYQVHEASDLSPIYYTPTAIRIFIHRVPTASGLIPLYYRMGVHLYWFAPPPTSTDVGLLIGVGYIPPTMGRSGILLEARFVPLTTGRSISGVFSKEFRLWTGSGSPACYRAFTIFSWKLGIMAFNDNAFQSWNHSIGPSF